MAFIIQPDPSDVHDTFTVEDRIEALRSALRWRSVGYQRVQVIGDGHVYSLKEFAGTIMIGEKCF